MSDRRVLLGRPRSTPDDPLGQRSAMERVWEENAAMYGDGAHKYEDVTVRRFKPFKAPAQSAVDRAFDITPANIWYRAGVEAAKDEGFTASVEIRMQEMKAKILMQATNSGIINQHMRGPTVDTRLLLTRRNK